VIGYALGFDEVNYFLFNGDGDREKEKRGEKGHCVLMKRIATYFGRRV
jgi:hypothetical protein